MTEHEIDEDCRGRAPPWALALTLLHEVRALRRELAEHRAATSAPPVPADDPVARLRAEAEALGVKIAMGSYVAEADAALLLGRTRGCLKHRRQHGNPVARPQKLLGRWHYLLTDLAEVLPEDLEENEL